MLSPITMILRGYTFDEVKNIAEVLKNSEFVKNMEITMNTEGSVEMIRKLSEEYSEWLNIGAGTVQTYDELVQVVEAGATFVLSPRMMTKEMLDYCKENNVISVPGAFTPSEIGDSFTQGADVVKVFPANELSKDYAKKVSEPMGNVALMAVGGVNAQNVQEHLKGGYKYIGTAGGLFPKEAIKNKDKKILKESLEKFEKEVAEFYDNRDED